jgi:integrase
LKGRSGSWCLRRYIGDQAYTVEALDAAADDFSEADGRTVLDFKQAQRLVMKQQGKARATSGLTVAEAVEAYLAHIGNRSSVRDAQHRMRAFVYPVLGALKVEQLTTLQLRKWLHDMAEAPPRARTKEGAPQNYLKADTTDEGRRRRQSSANRVLVTLKAVLNYCWREGNTPSDDAWRKVRPFAGTVSARIKYLTVSETQRLTNACEEPFRSLVRAALATGCSYGELGRLVAEDFNATSGTLHIRRSKSGKPRHFVLEAEGIASDS